MSFVRVVSPCLILPLSFSEVCLVVLEWLNQHATKAHRESWGKDTRVNVCPRFTLSSVTWNIYAWNSNERSNKSQMYILLLLCSKEVLRSWAWMKDVLASRSPNPHPTTPPIVARWLSNRPFLGQAMLISHHSSVNEVVSNATDNQMIWSWHLFAASPVDAWWCGLLFFTMGMNNAPQQGTKQTHHCSHLEKQRQYLTEFCWYILHSSCGNFFLRLQLCGNDAARSCCTQEVLCVCRGGVSCSPSSTAILNSSDS